MPQSQSLTTRMPNGATNAAAWQTFGDAGIGDPSWCHVYHNDFDVFNTNDWTTTKTGTGTVALTDADGGALLLTNTTGAADAIYMQIVNATFKTAVTGKRTFFKFAGQLSDIANSTFFAGLAQKGATTIASITDGIFISKDTSTTGALTLHVRKSSADVSIALPTTQALVAATAFELGIEVDSAGNVLAFFNPTTGANPISASASASGQARGYVASLPVPALPTALLSPSFGLLNASAAARSLQIDYLTVARER